MWRCTLMGLLWATVVLALMTVAAGVATVAAGAVAMVVGVTAWAVTYWYHHGGRQQINR